ncbi:hypothetical protein Tco_1403185 [Tanacetum coccineum]
MKFSKVFFHKGNKAQNAVSKEDQYAVLEIWNEYNILEDIKHGSYSKKSLIRLRMTKVIKREFEKIKDVKVEDVSLTCDTPLEVFNNEVNRLSGMDDDLFTYEFDVANIPCDLKMDDDSEHEVDDDMGYDPSDIAFTEWLGSKSYLLRTLRDSRPMKLQKNNWIMNGNQGDYHGSIRSILMLMYWKDNGYCNGGNLPGTYIIRNRLHYQNYEWYEALEDSELKDEALRNKAIMEGFINEGDDESRYEQERRWNIYTNYDDAYQINHEKEELCGVHELPVCNIRRYMMIKYLFNNDEEYVAVKEDEYDDLTITREEAYRAYQEIFRKIYEGWMVTRAE